MHIYDNAGKRIEVIDLNASLKQVRYFVGLRHTEPEYSILDDQLQEYWSDILAKLEALEQIVLNKDKNQPL